MHIDDKCSACSLVRDACTYIQVYVPFVAVGLTSAQRASTERLVDDASMLGKRDDDALSIYDCFKAFTQR